MRRTATLALTLALAGPVAADAFKPSKAEQVKLGKQAAQQVRQKYKVLPASDPRVKLLRSVGAKILSTVDDSKEPWEYSFDIIDSKEVNAFAFPGGPVFFFTGLINRMKTEDQMAAVLAHELVHVRREHWAYQYSDAQKRQLGLTLILILAKANRTAADLASLVDGLYDLKYSRGHETQSDDQGMDMMISAGYNPQGMSDIFQILRDASKGGKPPEILSSHPDDNNRIKRMDDRIKKTGKTFGPQRPLPWSSGTYSTLRAGLRWNW